MRPYVRGKIFRIPQGRIPYPPLQSGGYAKRPPLRGGSREAGGGESRVYIRSFGLRQGSLPQSAYAASSLTEGAFTSHTLSIIRVTISVAVFTYSPMLNCLTTSTS